MNEHPHFTPGELTGEQAQTLNDFFSRLVRLLPDRLAVTPPLILRDDITGTSFGLDIDALLSGDITVNNLTADSATITNETVTNLTVTGTSNHTGSETYSGPSYFTISGGIYMPQGHATVPSGTTDNWTVGSDSAAPILDLFTSGDATVTGTAAPPAGGDGFLQWLYNAGPNNVTLTSNDTTSTVPYQTSDSMPFTLTPGTAVPVKYNGTTNLVFSQPTTSSAATVTFSSIGTNTDLVVSTFTVEDTTPAMNIVLPSAGQYLVYAQVEVDATGTPDVGDDVFFNLYSTNLGGYLLKTVLLSPIALEVQVSGASSVYGSAYIQAFHGTSGADTIALHGYTNAPGANFLGPAAGSPSLTQIGYLKLS